MSNGKLKFPAFRLVAIAVAAGLVAGGIAVYVMGGPDGNRATTSAASETRGADQCKAKTDDARRVGDAATGQVAAMMAADPPRSVADLAFKGPDGNDLTIADFSGGTILMNLWATWCAPCREEMPELDALQAEMGSDDFQVVAVNVDSGDAEKPEKFLKETGADTLPLYREDTLTLFNAVKTRGLALGLPVTMLVDGDGCLLASMNGPAAWASDDAKTFLRSAMTPAG